MLVDLKSGLYQTLWLKKTDLKTIRTVTGLISLSFNCGVKLVKTIELHQNDKITCTKLHIKGSSEKLIKDMVSNPNSSKGKLNTPLLLM